MTEITDHLAIIERRVAAAVRAADRPADVLILAVSKGQPTAAIEAAFHAGIVDFGESYIDEAVRKMDTLALPAVTWHFIGRIQSNKTRTIAEKFDWVHTIDRAKIAERLSAQRPADKPPLNVLIQINLAGEPQKGGVDEAGAAALAALVDDLPRLKLRGLMTIPPAGLTPAEAADHFRRVASLAKRLARPGRPLDMLSMGMSGDFETAIACGSTCVRIGTALFGERRRGGV